MFASLFSIRWRKFFFSFLVRFPAVFELLRSPPAPPPPLFFFLSCAMSTRAFPFIHHLDVFPRPARIFQTLSKCLSCVLFFFLINIYKFCSLFSTLNFSLSLSCHHLLIRVPKMSNASLSLSLVVLCVLVYCILYILLLLERYSSLLLFRRFWPFHLSCHRWLAAHVALSSCQQNKTGGRVSWRLSCSSRFWFGFFSFFHFLQTRKTKQAKFHGCLRVHYTRRNRDDSSRITWSLSTSVAPAAAQLHLIISLRCTQ